MKKVILTFDYELFFGVRCGTVNGCLIVPTRKILDALRTVGGRAVFFIDYLMLKRMREQCDETRLDAERIESQLKEIVREGSRIELHLHPHWIDAKYLGDGQWDFTNYTHYCLDTLSKSEVSQMVCEGATYLNTIAQEVVPNYNVMAFRAGGWAIIPFNKLYEGFMKSGIRIDSSVCKGMILNGVNYRMDFSNSPSKDVYRFSTDVLSPEADGEFYEAQISSFRFNPITYVLDGIYRKFNRGKYRHHEEGSYMTNGRKMTSKPLPFLKRLSCRSIFGIGSTSNFALYFHLIRSRHPTAIIMGHPKDFNDLLLINITFLGRHVEFVLYDNVIDTQKGFIL